MTGAQYRCNCGRTDRRISNKCFGCGDVFTSDDQPQKPTNKPSMAGVDVIVDPTLGPDLHRADRERFGGEDTR